MMNIQYDALHLALGRLAVAYLVRSMGEGHSLAQLTTAMFYVERESTVPEAQRLLQRIFGDGDDVRENAPALKRYLGLEE